jgi:hypothetical protein
MTLSNGANTVENPPADGTVRLRKLQQPPPHVERLLDGLVTRARLVPQDAYQIRDPASVPKDLRRIAKLAAANGRAWSCWTYRIRTWLVTGEMPIPLSRERGAPVLQVDVYDEDGPKDCGLWMIARDGKWSRCND